MSVALSHSPYNICLCFPVSRLFFQHPTTALGTGGVMYGNGNIVSGPLESLIDLLMPANADDLDQVRFAEN